MNTPREVTQAVEAIAKVIGDTLHKCGKFDAAYDDSDWTRGPCLLAAKAVLAPHTPGSKRGN